MAASVDHLKAELEAEARELTARRDALRAELAEVEGQLEARENAAASLARIRPMAKAEAEAPAATEPVPAPAAPARRGRKAAAKKAPGRKAAAKKATAKAARAAAASEASGRRVRSNLRDEIAALLNASGEPMNVRQLTEALGEDTTKSRLESVRTSAEGLVRSGRASKPSRGQFAGAN